MMKIKKVIDQVNAVEDSYRAFKALTDRDDLLSKELQNVNHTITIIFLEQVHFSMDDADDDSHPAPPGPSKDPRIALLRAAAFRSGLHLRTPSPPPGASSPPPLPRASFPILLVGRVHRLRSPLRENEMKAREAA